MILLPRYLRPFLLFHNTTSSLFLSFHQVTIDGCPADCADGKAEASLFSTGFEAAIGIQVGLAPDNVEVTSVTVTKDTGVVAGT